MTTSIHPTAIVDGAAQLGEGVTIGAYSVVGPEVVIGDGVNIHNHVSLKGRTNIGEEVEVFSHASLGGPPQILGYRDSAESRLEIGPRTIIREFANLHTGSPEAGGLTNVGADCMIMGYSHIAHVCIIGDKCVIANGTQFGGHVTVGEQVWMGGLVAIHQYCRIGKHAFLGGGSIVVAHVIPYGSVIGNKARLAGLNIVGLKRRGFERQTIHDLRAAYRLLFAEEGTFSERLVDTEKTYAQCREVSEIVEFIKAAKSRAICMPG